MQLTKNFHLSEFQCKDGSEIPDELMENIADLANNLQVLRTHLGKAIRINSAYRSPQYNAKIGGATKSKHLLGMAADIVVRGMDTQALAAEIEHLISCGKMTQGGIGTYRTFVHYDVRGTKARWNG